MVPGPNEKWGCNAAPLCFPVEIRTPTKGTKNLCATVTPPEIACRGLEPLVSSVKGRHLNRSTNRPYILYSYEYKNIYTILETKIIIFTSLTDAPMLSILHALTFSDPASILTFCYDISWIIDILFKNPILHI